MFQFQYPEFLLLAIPLVFVSHRWGEFRLDWKWLLAIPAWIAFLHYRNYETPWWLHLWLAVPIGMALIPWFKHAGMTGAIRLAIVSLLLVGLTGPEWNLGGKGIDVIIVADRSRSLPANYHSEILEVIRNIESNRGTHDRVALVGFGVEPEVEHHLDSATITEQFQKVIPIDGSDLNAAIQQALGEVDENRPARIIVLTDGEANGGNPVYAARQAREDGVPIDFRLYERSHVGDAAVRGIELPQVISPREPYQFSVDVYSDHETSGVLTIRRDGQVIATQEPELYPGSNRIIFRDIVEQPGIHEYSVSLETEGDPLAENNVGRGIVRVETSPRILVLNADGQDGNLGRVLKAANLPVDVAVASEHPVTLDSLDPYRAVIIENVPASDFGRVKMEALASFVQDLGGGLLLTGGQRSFGVGGYFNSPLDEVLPVSMEMREEHRKGRVAIAIALDRSGSMMASVGGGRVKMDLANIGTAECIRLLSSMDSVSVYAVDSTPHEVQALTPVTDPESIASNVLRIESMGGGIFVYEALVAAGDSLMDAEQSTRHIILFSDAMDSEEPGNYKQLLADYTDAGITVSVIGLGKKTDIDSQLLIDIAKRGGGNIMFTEDAEELPRLFTEDTMSIARSSFIEADPATQPGGIGGELLADGRLLGNLGQGTFPTVGGYNLSYLKPDATSAVTSTDEYLAPWAAFWYRGLGRAAAITLEVDGEYSGGFGNWDHYDDFLITHARWLLGGEPPDEVFVDITREGQEAVVTVELDSDRPDRGSGEAPQVFIIQPGDDNPETIEPALTWVGPDTLEARFRMERTGTYRTVVQTGEEELTRGPAVSLPYSPEFEPREGLPSGKDIMEEIAALSGGMERVQVLDVFQDPPRSSRTASLLPWIFIASVILLLLEIAGRRLSLWERLAEVKITGGAVEPARWLPQWKLKLPAWGKGAQAQHARSAAADAPTTVAASEIITPAPKPVVKPAAQTKTAADVYAAAKSRAKKRMQ
jgi:Mg-chelatase subunit ChlD